MSNIPTGTVTFLFSDIEGSTKLAQQHPDAWPSAQARHHVVLNEAIATHHGHVFQMIGDAFCAAFATATDALAAALAAQRVLHAEPRAETGPIRVRIGLHTGPAVPRGDDYEGYLSLSHTKRLVATAYGGQVLLSQATEALLHDQLPPDVSLRDLGEHRLKDFAQREHIYQAVTLNLPADFPPLNTLDAFPNNLPVQLTSFVGREREIAEVKRLLGTTRLLTLTGVGGTGKTRLSLKVASDVVETFRDGVWLVELAPLADPALVPQTVAAALNLREEAGRSITTTLTDYLRDKKLLLILDNCEHLLEACAQLATTLLRSCPHVTILATSREASGIAGEVLWHVPSLSLPDAQQPSDAKQAIQFEAVRLFAERASAAQTHFAVTDQNARAVAQICRRLDGIPLALELAAARVKSLSVEDIAARLHNQFRLLTGGSRTALPRQQTLRALIDWSYNLLTEPERVLLRRLSVFAGGWTLEAAEAVCAGDGIAQADVLDLLAHLVDKSLVSTATLDGEMDTPTSGAMRYRFLETIRQYARDKLLESDEGERVRDQHLDYFMRLAEEAEPKIRSAEQISWLHRLEAELENVRVALDWSGGGANIEKGLRLAAALDPFWGVRGHQTEGIEILRNLLARPEATARTLLRARALNTLSMLYWKIGSYHQCKIAADEALAIGQELRDTPTIADALLYLSNAKIWQGSDAEAQALLDQSLAMYRALGDKPGVMESLVTLGVLAFRVGDYKRAQSWLAEAVTLGRELDDKGFLSAALRYWGFALFHQHDVAGALRKFQESLILNAEIEDKQGVAACLAACATVALTREQFERAAHLFGAAEAVLESIHAKLLPTDHDQYTRNVAALLTQLDEVAFKAAWAAGRALTMEQAIELAMSDEQ